MLLFLLLSLRFQAYHSLISNPHLPRPNVKQARLGYEINRSATAKAWVRITGCREQGVMGQLRVAVKQARCLPVLVVLSSVFGRAFNIGNLEVRTAQFLN